MPDVTFIADDVRTVDATVDGDRVLVEPSQLPTALGWELKPEGLCRDDVCVPVRDRLALYVDDRLDVERVAAALERPVVVDAGARVVSIALPAEERRLALDGLAAPSFALADVDGGVHQLEEWRGKKKLLVAFASW
jgi:hypothetical protein